MPTAGCQGGIGRALANYPKSMKGLFQKYGAYLGWRGDLDPYSTLILPTLMLFSIFGSWLRPFNIFSRRLLSGSKRET